MQELEEKERLNKVNLEDVDYLPEHYERSPENEESPTRYEPTHEGQIGIQKYKHYKVKNSQRLFSDTF